MSLDTDSVLLHALGQRAAGHSLPGRMYTDPDVLAEELERIWLRRWVFAGHVSEVRQPGDYLTVRIGPASLIVIRGNDGALRALHNVCRHRGSVLCEQESGTLRRIVCPYHQWSYALDGSLARACHR
jgi:Rieske 2Fe-2S family protein